MKHCALGIRLTDAPNAKATGKQMFMTWFPSMVMLEAALSEENHELLRLIQQAKHKTELAALWRGQVPNHRAGNKF